MQKKQDKNLDKRYQVVYPSEDVVRFLARNFPDEHHTYNILDLGCGFGRHSFLCAEQGFKTSAIDVIEERVIIAIRMAEERNLKIHFNVGNMLDLPFSDGQFDGIIA